MNIGSSYCACSSSMVHDISCLHLLYFKNESDILLLPFFRSILKHFGFRIFFCSSVFLFNFFPSLIYTLFSVPNLIFSKMLLPSQSTHAALHTPIVGAIYENTAEEPGLNHNVSFPLFISVDGTPTIVCTATL